MKIRIIQYYIGNDEKYLKLCKLAEQLNSKYCSLYNYQYQFVYPDTKETEWKKIIRYKLSLIYDNLINHDCDYLVFLDADAAISKPTIKIEDFIDDQHQLFLSRNNQRYGIINTMVSLYNKLATKVNDQTIMFSSDIDQLGKDMYAECQQLSVCNIHHNEGFYIIKNSSMMKQFFKDCLELSRYTINTIRKSQSVDGRTIQYMLQVEKYHPIYTYMCNKAQGGNASSYQFSYDAEETFLLHNYGSALNIDQKIQQIKSLKNNKWWKRAYLKQKKFKVVSYTVGSEQKYLEMLNLTKELNSKYCQLNEYQFQLITINQKDVQDAYGEFNSFNMNAYRIKFIYQQLMKNDCDYLVFLDTDAVISNPNIKFEDVVDYKHQFYLSRGNIKYDLLVHMADVCNSFNDKFKQGNDLINKSVLQYVDNKIQSKCYALTYGKQLHNEGFYIIKNTPIMQQFYKEANLYMNLLIDNKKCYSAEENIILLMLQKDKYKDLYTFMYNRAQSSIASSYDFSYDIDKTFVMHNYTSFTMEQKIDYIKQIKQNKWWKEILNEN